MLYNLTEFQQLIFIMIFNHRYYSNTAIENIISSLIVRLFIHKPDKISLLNPNNLHTKKSHISFNSLASGDDIYRDIKELAQYCLSVGSTKP